MINIYIRQNNNFSVFPFSQVDDVKTDEIVWIDVISPTHIELQTIADKFDVEFPTQNERESIETSSRYWEDNSEIVINAFFLVSFFFTDKSNENCNEIVTFILKNKLLISVRYKELKTFGEVEKIVLHSKTDMKDGEDIFMKIFEIRVETDAGLLEYAAKEINSLRKSIFSVAHKITDEEILEKISTIQEFNLRIRETISDKRRITVGLLKSNKISEKTREDLKIMIKDVGSLIEFTTINLNALDNIQNLFIGQINIDQSRIIKIFTVVNVALMPPTLIASVYGMNFKFMPELDWELGYPFAIIFMIASAIIPLWYFRIKKWF